MNRVLIVVDMQNDFIDGILGTEAAKEIVPHVADYIKEKREKGYHIVFTRDEHGADYDETKEGDFIKPHCLKWTPGFEFNPEIKSLVDPETDYVVYKNAFGAIDLISVLKEIAEKDGDINAIEICGLCADICVLANAVIASSICPNARINVISDLCASFSPITETALEGVFSNLLIGYVSADVARIFEKDDDLY